MSARRGWPATWSSVALLVVARAAPALAQLPPAPPPPAEALAPAEPDEAGDDASEASLVEQQIRQNEELVANRRQKLTFAGYVDFGYFATEGNGSGVTQDVLHTYPGYAGYQWVFPGDLLAPAINSRGEVADLGDLPGVSRYDAIHSGGAPGFIVNEVNLRLRATPAPNAIITTSVNFTPRTGSNFSLGDMLDVDLAQLEWLPGEAQRTSIFVGKIESVLGIEYRQRKSDQRFGITPSLIARYTTGQSVGAKLFYRLQLAPLWSALSINLAATNSGTFVDALQTPDISLTGVPVGSVRLGYELNLPRVQVKLGASGMYGVRNDQSDRSSRQMARGADLRVALFGIYLNVEAVMVDEDQGGPKTNDSGQFMLASGFHGRGIYGQLAYALVVDAGPLHKITPYARYEQRHAWFEGFTPLTVERTTLGVRVDLWESLIVKAELIVNRELAGAPNVANNVETTSVVYSW